MSEIEKQFYKTFEIEPKLLITKDDWEKCKNLPRAEELFKQYPKITDCILLELISICVLYGWHLCRYWNGNQDFVYENQRLKPEERFCVIDTDLKNATLILLIELVNKEGIKHQVQALFKGE